MRGNDKREKLSSMFDLLSVVRGKSRVLVAVPFFFWEDEVLIDWIGARSVRV